jgi:hypothetical protein
MHRKIQMLQVLLLSLSSKKDAVMDKVPKQPMTHTLNQNKSSIIIQVMTNDILLQLCEKHLTSTRTGRKVAVYWRLFASANSR